MRNNVGFHNIKINTKTLLFHQDTTIDKTFGIGHEKTPSSKNEREVSPFAGGRETGNSLNIGHAQDVLPHFRTSNASYTFPLRC